MGDEDWWLWGGLSYVHNYLHNHNIFYVKNIYHWTLSNFHCPLAHVLMCVRLSYRPPSLLHSPSCLCQHTFQRTCLHTPSSIHMTSPHKTRPRNATKHPGLIGKTSTVHQNSAQVKAAAAAKRATKDAKDAARTASICHAKEFESTALDNEDLIDATP